MTSASATETKNPEVELNRAGIAREVAPEGREAMEARAAAAADPQDGEPLFVIDDSSDLPLWVQLRNRLAHLIRSGYFKAGEQLPSLRSLSAEAKLNYNTVVKAYRDLEVSNLIVSIRGRGIFVQKDVVVDDSPESAVDAMAEQCVHEYRAIGLSFRDINKRLAGIVQQMADEAANAADEKRSYYDGKH